MPTIDSQVHAYERNHPGRPWAAVLHGPPEVTGDQMVAAMDAVGVDGAILVSPFTMYRYDASYALEVQQRHPGRFGLVKPLDVGDPAVGDTVAAWAKTPGAEVVLPLDMFRRLVLGMTQEQITEANRQLKEDAADDWSPEDDDLPPALPELE